MSGQIDVLNPIVTLVAACAGAGAAFFLENLRRIRQEIKEHVKNGNLALFMIFHFWESVNYHHEHHVLPYKKRNDAWLNMPVTTHQFFKMDTMQDIDLAFLLKTKYANLYADLFKLEENFDRFLGQSKHRDDLLLNTIWPRLADAGLNPGDKITEIINAIGTDTHAIIIQLSNGIVENTCSNVVGFKMAYNDLRAALLSIYPKQRFITLVFSDDDASTNNTPKE